MVHWAPYTPEKENPWASDQPASEPRNPFTTRSTNASAVHTGIVPEPTDPVLIGGEPSSHPPAGSETENDKVQAENATAPGEWNASLSTFCTACSGPDSRPAPPHLALSSADRRCEGQATMTGDESGQDSCGEGGAEDQAV